MAQVLVVYLRQKVKCRDAMSRPSFSIPAGGINEVPIFKTSSSSVPSSPAKLGLQEDHRQSGASSRSTPPPAGSDGLGPLKPLAGGSTKSGVTTIKEEVDQVPADQPRQSTSLRQRNSGSRGLAGATGGNNTVGSSMQRGGSVGRHPSGQHSNLQHAPNAGLAPLRQSQSANVSLVANSGLPRPEMTTDFIAWSAKFFNKQLMKNEYVESGSNDHESNRHWSREWMFHRNAKVRSRAEHEHQLLRNRMCKIDNRSS